MPSERFIVPLTENFISKLAQDETGKRQYYRPVYSLHKWWARWPGALFRANGSDNELFLHFMGELLRAASAVPDEVDYDWFAESLVRFDEFSAELPRRETLEKVPLGPRQLRLLNGDNEYRAKL